MIGALLGLLASAWAATCTTPLTEPPAGMSVAWVSPLGARAAARGYLTVVPTAELTRWVAAERPSLGRLLQHGYREALAHQRQSSGQAADATACNDDGKLKSLSAHVCSSMMKGKK